ncbi:Glycosyltransferase involved in cell wall bisynthesis [Desulfotomaculum arcticum]|uniref:Glycosyltransferase involved in cell wall bisynthesis n=1 Tax=Desulfotruncus arcticus DSM 17038 TaxID=1121424 RepID=A0A1I2VKV0_9FIRM|nr:glycosyltransferase family 4 protein [Desulfotruncus arcticus]SFG89944.1 Glycosyltransferase involved in cell wall bisynthesis [Desulfotomaculum arcticum] [Desulfotruncus arcticus DSM 17038]
MGVLIFLSSSGRGGRELNTIRLLPYLQERGLKIVVLVLDCGGYVTQWCCNNGVNCHSLGLWPSKLNFIAVAWRFFLIIVKTQTDLIQVYGFTASMLCRFIARPMRVKVVVGIVGAGHFIGLRPLYERLTKKLVNCYVANSCAGKNTLLQIFGAYPTWIAVIHNGVPELKAPPPLIAKKYFTIGTVANLRPEKGYDVMLKALAQVKSELGGEIIFKYLIVGDGALRKALTEQIHNLGLTEQVYLLGLVENVTELLYQLDLFVLPSYTEGFPNALLEAMMAGRCVIATNVGGVPEVIEDEYNGLMVEPGNPAELSRAIKKVILNSQLQKSMALKGREVICNNFTLTRQAEETIRVWQEVYQEGKEVSR